MIAPKNILASFALKAPPGAPTQEWLEGSAVGHAEGYVVQITPSMAEEWLKMNSVGGHTNRKFRSTHANTFAAEMRAGQWRLTHQGIAFGTTGRLIDGQHRLTAVIESQTTQPMLVFINAPEDNFDNFDRGASRNLADILRKDASLTALATSIVRTCVSHGGVRGRKAMPAEVDKLLNLLAVDIEAMKAASTTHRKSRTLAPIRAAWCVHHHFATPDEQKLLKQQWRAFADYEPKKMDDSTEAGEKCLARREQASAHLDSEGVAIGWLMFNPQRRDLLRIVIHNLATPLDDFRATVRRVVPELMLARADKQTAGKRATTNQGGNPALRDPVLGPAIRERARAASQAAAEARRAQL